MNFNTANNTFRQLMGNSLLYRVPPFQWSLHPSSSLSRQHVSRNLIYIGDSTVDRDHFASVCILLSSPLKTEP